MAREQMGQGGERARERTGHGAKGPRSERARKRIGQGPIGRFAPGSELARERKGSESPMFNISAVPIGKTCRYTSQHKVINLYSTYFKTADKRRQARVR